MSTQTKEVATIDNASGKVILQETAKYSITLASGKKLSPIDIFSEAEEVQQTKDLLEQQEGTFAEHFVMLAMQCGKLEVFTALCEQIAERLHWGRPPKGTPKIQLASWKAAPSVYVVYKSQIINAWEAGIEPGKTVTYTQKLPRANKAGETEKQVVTKATTPQIMTKARNTAKAKAEAGKPAAPKAGVVVDSKGEEHRHSGEAADKQLAASKTMAAMVDPELASLLSQVVTAYDNATIEGQEKCKNRLARLVRDMKGWTKENEKAAAEVAANA